MTPRPAHRAARTIAAIASWLALAALVAGVPATLYAVSGSPVPHSLPSGHQVFATLGSHDNGTLFLAAIRYLTWIAWACFALSVLVEAISRARGRPAPRLPVIAPVQGVAAALIGAAILSTVPFPHGLRPAQPPARPAQATAAAAPPRPGDPLQVVTTALTLPAEPGLTTGTSTPGRPRYRQYEVAGGDNLWDIAQRFLHDGEDWHELYQLNEGRPQPDGEALEEPGLIQPGWELLIPESATADGTARQPRPAGAGTPHSRTSPRAPRPGSSPRATPPAPGTHQHSRPRHVAVSLPSGAIIGIAVAVMVAAALTLAAIQRRRRYRPRHHHLTASLRPAQPPPPPVIAALQRAARPAPPDAPGSAEEPEPPGDPYLDLYQPLPEPGDDQPGVPDSRPAPGVSRARSPAPRFQGPVAASPPDGPRGGLAAGLDGDREAAIDIAALGGLGLAGPGAAAAARALLAALLAQAPPPVDGMPARIIIPAPDAERLLPGTDAATIPGVSVPATLGQALDEMEALILGQARETGALDPDDDRPPPPAGRPGAALIATCDAGTQQRLRAILQAGRPLGAAAVLLGSWAAGTTCQVAADGTITAVTPPSAGLDGIRLFTLDPADAAAITGVLREASGTFPAGPWTAPADLDDQPPAPAGQATGEDPPSAGPSGGNSPGQPALTAPLAPARHAEAPRQPPAAAGPTDGGPPDPGTPQAPGTRPVRLALLGPLQVTARGEEVAGGMRKARELLALLAVHPDGISGEAVSEALWPEADAAQATPQRNLALRKARDLLRAATGMATPMWIINAAGRYRLDPALITTDLAEFQDALDQARRASSSDARLAACRAAVALYRGEFAEGAAYEWAEPHAETARRRALDAWTTIAEILQAADPDQALSALETALGHDPYNEYLYVRIMRLQAAAGRPEAVRRTLALLESKLTDLGITPSSQTRQATAALLAAAEAGPGPSPGTPAPPPGATDQRQ